MEEPSGGGGGLKAEVSEMSKKPLSPCDAACLVAHYTVNISHDFFNL